MGERWWKGCEASTKRGSAHRHLPSGERQDGVICMDQLPDETWVRIPLTPVIGSCDSIIRIVALPDALKLRVNLSKTPGT